MPHFSKSVRSGHPAFQEASGRGNCGKNADANGQHQKTNHEKCELGHHVSYSMTGCRHDALIDPSCRQVTKRRRQPLSERSL